MKVALLSFSTRNLGDDLQALATACFLPRVDVLIDRDNFDGVSVIERHLLVMNAWFGYPSTVLKHQRHELRPPGRLFEPLFFGFCVGTDDVLSRSWLDYMAVNQPIGCRDFTSVTKLAEANISGEWTGCITAHLGKMFTRIPSEERKGVLFVDIPAVVEKEFVPAPLRERAGRLSTCAPPAILGDPIQRMHYVASLCDQLRHAELVVTKRLHVALPCVGFGTPVIVILQDRPNDVRRFSGFDEFLPMILHGRKIVSRNVDWDRRDGVTLPKELERHFKGLKSRLQSQLGPQDYGISPNIAQSREVRLENPGLGPEPGEIAIDMGTGRIGRQVSWWTDREIVFKTRLLRLF